MPDREKVIKATELLDDFFNEYRAVYYISPHEAWEIIKDALKEQEEETKFVYDEHTLPMCEKCTFHPFAGYIPTIKWMKERGYMKCPRCGRSVKWE